MYGPIAFPPPQARRRLILGGAFLLALLVSLPHKTAPASAEETKAPASNVLPAPPDIPSAGDGKRHIEINIGPGSARGGGEAGKDGDSATEKSASDKDSTRTIVIKKGDKTVTVRGVPRVTLSRGEVVARDARVLSRPGRGQLVLRQRARA